jgi:ABC-type nitrate/sulfonate/bicarbonate transport system substrate-binding protein
LQRADANSVTLGFRAFDMHELLLHFLALRLGFYRERGLNVILKDLTFTPDEQLDSLSFTTACGATLLARRKGVRRRVVLVATDFPLFWMHAHNSTSKVEELKATRIGGYPPMSPPWHFQQIILRNHGLDPDRDVQLEAMRDDHVRMGLLRSGDVQAAVVSSVVPPSRVRSMGFRTLLFFGDEIRIPTAGLTAHEELLQNQPDLVQKMVAAFCQSLDAIHKSPGSVIPVITDLVGGSQEIVEEAYSWAHRCFTSGGKAAQESVCSALRLTNEGAPPEQQLTEEELYDYSFLPKTA